MRSRLSALLLALVAVLALAGCDSNVGTAAKVGDRSISESQVMTYLTPQGTPFANDSGQLVEPKPLVLTFLARQAFAEQLLAQTPQGVPNEGDLQQAEAQSLQSQGETRQDIYQLYTEKGFTRSAGDLAIRSNTLVSILAQRLPQLGSQFLTQHRLSVYVDPRYGTWDPNNLRVTGGASEQLPFLQLQGSYAPVVSSQ